MTDVVVSCVTWVIHNKEWLFSGIGVVLVISLLSLFPRTWRFFTARLLREKPKTSAAAPNQKHAGRSFEFSWLLMAPVRFYRWLSGRIGSIREHFAEKELQRRRKLYQDMAASTVFFSQRFADAFPGCRELQVIDDPAEAVRRLTILLARPLSVRIEHKGGAFGFDPIWWFRGWRNAPIRSYRRLRKRLVLPTNDILLNEVELHRVRRVVGLGSMAYWASAVYVETEGVPASGVYADEPSDYAKRRGYNYEEVGIYKGRFITREEYDDGAAVINGKPVRTLGKAKLQARYLSPYNFLIVAVTSPINDNQNDRRFEEAMKAVLEKKMSLEELAALVRSLPRNPKEDITAQRAEENLTKR